MPAPYTCPCGELKVTFPQKSTARIEGGYFPNNQNAIIKCRVKDCSGKLRLGYSIEFAKDGEVYHKPGRDGPGGKGHGKTATRKPARKKDNDAAERITFKFLD